MARFADVTPAPVEPAARISSLDVLRGFAVLGILVMNIQAFSMIGSAYINPTSYGDLTGANYWVWVLSHVPADQKFISLFSMLFGAGIVLMARKTQQGGARPASCFRGVVRSLPDDEPVGSREGLRREPRAQPYGDAPEYLPKLFV
jgi:uncharacterized membrane protein YeiB